ncbi:hypothetical protein HXA34_20475 [Salipaludibacillus agaradhaerens]|uniref:hypothetical protein n=1 Tax=Salipaludibacillus agaradhaerens TaxID=76935 RepID=UPI0021509298|nr:hypothetical protein [Salipaludibacillus agaradhaerens]MCR6108674.1 hypothetical protein [Salipaludibacillus agaradhaerens]MCR6120698.1 hypothetical protein [Salipaludibacillus agaradhaerens]
MIRMEVGMTVKPLTGSWKGVKGAVIEIAEGISYPIIVEFEDNEINRYYEEQLEILDRTT